MAFGMSQSRRIEEHVGKILEDNHIDLTWGYLGHNLGKQSDRDALMSLLEEVYPVPMVRLVKSRIQRENPLAFISETQSRRTCVPID